jgi:hypothetical protein
MQGPAEEDELYLLECAAESFYSEVSIDNLRVPELMVRPIFPATLFRQIYHWLFCALFLRSAT